MLKRTGMILLGVSLIPFCIGFLWALATAAVTVAYKPLVPYWFAGGVLLYFGIHLLFKRPVLSYVVGHELTHAAFAVLFGGSVKAFHASERGGKVHLTKSNVIITLAPYFFPLYTFVALVAYWLAQAAGAVFLEPWFVLLAGATFSFHIILTVIFLQADQDDIREHGAFFSYPLILLFNTVLSALLLRVLLARDMSFLSYLGDGIIKSIGITVLGFRKLASLVAG